MTQLNFNGVAVNGIGEPIAERRPCERCKGTGITVREAFTYHCSVTGQSKHYPRKESPCNRCNGAGTFDAPNFATIRAAIAGRKPGTLRSSRPKDARAYYVWRLARFHGGADITMPVMAGIEIGGDPFAKDLDALADAVAKEIFGSNLRAAYRWGKALGHIA